MQRRLVVRLTELSEHACRFRWIVDVTARASVQTVDMGDKRPRETYWYRSLEFRGKEAMGQPVCLLSVML